MTDPTTFEEDLALLRHLRPPTVVRCEKVDALMPLSLRGWIIVERRPECVSRGFMVLPTREGKTLLDKLDKLAIPASKNTQRERAMSTRTRERTQSSKGE